MVDGAITAREFDAVIGGVRGALETLARTVADGAERSSKEHAEVHEQLREIRRQLDTSVPTTDEYERFKAHVYGRLDQHDDDLSSRRGADRLLARLAAIVVGSAAVGGVLLGLASRLLG